MGAAGGMAAAGRTKGAADNALRGGAGNQFRFLENLLLPYEDLLAMGRLKGNKDFRGLQPGETRLGRAIEGYSDTLAASDPIFAQYRQTVMGGLEGIENGGIPSDLRRSITEGLRSSQASRGILDSNTAAIEEVVRLMGGQEMIRSQRLAEAQNYFGQVTQGALRTLLPGIDTLYTGELQRSIQGSQNALGAGQIGAGITTGIANSII